jgi:hypothetical protein
MSAKDPDIVSTVLEDVFPVIALEDASQPEAALLAGWRRFSATAVVPAGGTGVFGRVEIFLPAQTNSIAVIELVGVWPGAGGTILHIDWGVSVVGGAPAITVPRDSRFTGGSNVRVETSSDLAAVGYSAGNFLLDPSRVNFLQPGWVLAPGGSLRFGLQLANTAFVLNAWWRERSAETSELSF